MFALFNGATTAFFFFFFNDTATTEIYTLSLHDALPISSLSQHDQGRRFSSWTVSYHQPRKIKRSRIDRKSTRLNSSHVRISYAVFCLKKKKTGFFSKALDAL